VKRLFPILYLLFITGIVHFVVVSFYKVAESYVPVMTKTQPVVQKSKPLYEENKRQLPFSNYTVIQERNLFKTKTKAMEQVEKVEEKPVVVEEPIKPTELKLKLLGTIAGDKEYAHAVIEDLKKRNQDLYREGDPIQGAMIVEIRRGSVILEVDNRKEILTMADDQALSAAQSSGKDIASRKQEPQQPDMVTLSRAELQNSMKNINQLMSQIRIRPHFNRGRPDGLSVNNIRRNSIFYTMGLKNGDIIQGVNDKSIKTVDDVMALYQQLNSVSDLTLQVKRRGAVQNLKYSIK